MWALSEQIGGSIGMILKPVTVIDKMYSTVKIPFLLLYFILTLATTVLVMYAKP